MAVTTTQLIKQLIQRLQTDHPNLTFSRGNDFLWSSDTEIITYNITDEPNAPLLLLHELGHAINKHQDFALDIELISQEREAWDVVCVTLGPRYEIEVDNDFIEAAIDTYREWLHKRSLCPRCGLTGLQTETSTYQCINCRCSWRPNDARRCALRRRVLA